MSLPTPLQRKAPRSRVALVVLAGLACAGSVATMPGSEDAGTGSTEPSCMPLQGEVTALEKGTYCVTGDVIIPTGVTLDIPAGTTFIVKGRYHFGRDPAVPDLEPPAIAGSGSIHALGTAEEPIVFRGETPDVGWFGIVVSHSHDTVHLEHVTIRDTYKDDGNANSSVWRRGGALSSYLNHKGTILRHCTFTHNRALTVGGAVEITGHGQWPNEGPVEISNSVFEDNSAECGIWFGADACGGGAVRLTLVNGDDTLVKISGNTFRGNAALRLGTVDAFGGALGGSAARVTLGPGNVFAANRAATGDGAISCNREPKLGTVVARVDPSVVFTANSPDNGCGR